MIYCSHGKDWTWLLSLLHTPTAASLVTLAPNTSVNDLWFSPQEILLESLPMPKIHSKIHQIRAGQDITKQGDFIQLLEILGEIF